jgi:hypothetical protein
VRGGTLEYGGKIIRDSYQHSAISNGGQQAVYLRWLMADS